MRYTTYSYRNADIVLNNPKFQNLYQEVLDAIENVSDEDLLEAHKNRKNKGRKSSLSHSINKLLKNEFINRGWKAESPIFQGEEYGDDKVWKLDFAKDLVSIEVGFNHGEAIAWNLLKPVLASEVNNVKKAIKTVAGIFITATKDLKDAGCFDNAVGEYEKVLRYLVPMSTLMSVPILVIGLLPPERFELVRKYPGTPKNWGEVVSENL